MRGLTWAALLGVEVREKRKGQKLVNSAKKEGRRRKVLLNIYFSTCEKII